MKKYILSLVSLLLASTLVFQLPSLHYQYIRSHTSKTLVKIYGKFGGGTGFHIKTSKGNVYILTNSHVCDLSEDGYLIDVVTHEGRRIKRRIIENSVNTDLCLVEPVPNTGYLTLGSESKPGQIVAAVGHPHLMPDTMSRGEVIAKEVLKVPLYPIFVDSQKKECNKPKNEIIKLPTFFGEIEACAIRVNAMLTNVLILPGSSGSPVVNFWGNLTGVMFAGNGAGWGFYVQYAEVEKFLMPY